MEPDYITRCDLCKIVIALGYCDFCHVNLCKPCIGEHISDEYDKHKIVPFQHQRSTLIYPKCKTHPDETCKYQCKDCNIFLCTDCLASNQHHEEHKLLKLIEIFKKKKEHIQKDQEEMKEHLLPIYEEITSELENQIDNLDVDYKKLIIEMSKHREELHREIDNATNEREKEIEENKMKHLSILKKHLDEIKQLQTLMQDSLHELNEMEETNEVIPTIHYTSKNQEFSKLPPKVKVSMPNFIPKPIEKENLCSLFGKLTPLSTTLEERVFTAKKPNTSVRELLDESEVLKTINTEFEKLRNVVCLNEEEIWTCGMTPNIKIFNSKGVLQKTRKTKLKTWPNDIAVYRDGTLVYSDWETKTVDKLKNDKTEEIIRLQGWIPTQLCVTSFGDLLVSMSNDGETQCKVVRYSGSTAKQTIQFDDDGQPLYSGNDFTKYITENRNLDICVADNRAGAIVVVNQAGKLRIRYTGHPSFIKNEPFHPSGITTDSQSRIITSDGKNHCIHILDVNGQFLRYIDNCDLKSPTGLCLDNDDNLFVCEHFSGIVKKIRYLK